jgi:hypothetical protein
MVEVKQDSTRLGEVWDIVYGFAFLFFRQQKIKGVGVG